MQVKEFITLLQEQYPESYQESFDHSGAQILFGEDIVAGVLIALDLDAAVIDDALSKDCNVIVTHHPYFFKPLHTFTEENPHNVLLYTLLLNRISVYALHTNLDKIYYNRLGTVLGLLDQKVLLPDRHYRENSVSIGFGSSGTLQHPIQAGDFLAFVKEKLDVSYLLYIGKIPARIKNIALLNGAGGSQLERICAMNEFDCIVTGDIGYHHAKTAQQYPVLVIDAGHFATEVIFCDFLKAELLDYLTKLKVNNEFKIAVTKAEEDPFRVYI